MSHRVVTPIDKLREFADWMVLYWRRWLAYVPAKSVDWLDAHLGGKLPVYKPTFSVSGREILDALTVPVVLRGVNKMAVWDGKDPQGAISMPEIGKTGANTVRIVWAIRKDLQPGPSDTNLADLDALITNAKAHGLVPMIELHDATGNLGRLPDLVAYWTQPAVVALIKKHQRYLLVNIGNEAAGWGVDAQAFKAAYIPAVQQMRAAGIETPLVIDAPDYGKDIDTLNLSVPALLAADPLKKLIFSVHIYWGTSSGQGAAYIATKLSQAWAMNYALIVGEFSETGAVPPGQTTRDCGPAGAVDYAAVVHECGTRGIGWYAWEWGPGNGHYKDATGADRYDGPCAAMDMTTDRTFANLRDGWPKEVCTTLPYSIKNTAKYVSMGP